MSCFMKIKDKWNAVRYSNGVMIGVVYATLLVDSILLTAVVPILPEFFFKKHQKMEMLETTTETTFSATNLQYTDNFTGSIDPTMQSMNQSGVGQNGTNCHISKENAFLSEENLYIGILFASKPMVQIVANSAVGPLTDVIGFDIPMLVGYVVMCVSATIFSFGRTYPVLLVGRALQGIGSACASTAGMGMLASRYEDDAKRGRALGIALGGLAMGVLTGPVFGSVIYQLAGKESVFIVLAALAFLLALGLLVIRDIKVGRIAKGDEGTPLYRLLMDPYIILVAGTLMLGNVCIGTLEATLPIWMIKTMCSPKWALGIAFLPFSVSYFIMTNLSALFCQHHSRWIQCILALLSITAGCIGLPFARSLPELIAPGLFIGGGIGVVDTSMFPVMGYLVDNRHKPVYGSVYAIADASFCAAFIIGPLGGGALSKEIGFHWMLWIVAIATALYSPLVFLLKKAYQPSEETIPILPRSSNDSPDDVFASDRNGAMMDSSH